MQLKALLSDDDAVSPVIGVILMVAITVILAAVIATFVLGLGDNLSNTAPQATFTADYNEDPDPSELTITMTGGERIPVSELSISGNDDDSAPGWSNQDDSHITAGSSITVETDGDGPVRILWNSDQGGQSSTLYTWEN